MRHVLLDTGPLVALLDRSEKKHRVCTDFLSKFDGELLTTEPVLTESLYLLGQSIQWQRTCIEFILKGGATLVPQSSESLARAMNLMEKYSDIPMDFADATLITLAEETGVEEIFTLDHRGFNTYRLHGRKRGTILP